MGQVYHHHGGVTGRIGEADDAAARCCGKLGLYSVVRQEDGVVAGTGCLCIVTEGRFAFARYEHEVSKIRDACSAKVGKAEAHDCGLCVLVACGNIVVVVVCVRAYLYASEGNLCARINVTEAGCPYKGVYILSVLCKKAGREEEACNS